jgi:hypothetical protein
MLASIEQEQLGPLGMSAHVHGDVESHWPVDAVCYLPRDFFHVPYIMCSSGQYIDG